MFSRTILFLGEEKFLKIKKANIILFGLGGVGGYVLEGLVRSGVENITIVDYDKVDVSNINRQLIATKSNIGLLKTDLYEKRSKEINENVKIKKINLKYLKENSDEIDFNGYDYIIDAIDTITSKVLLVMKAKEHNIPIISCMGTGNKLYPSMFEICDISKTTFCPVARRMRDLLRSEGIKHLKVVYSKEVTSKNVLSKDKHSPGSISFTPPVAAFLMVSEVINDIISDDNN